MSTQRIRDREGAYRTIGLITFLYGIIFFVVIWVGYYLLFGGTVVGGLVGVVLGVIAVAIAKLLGGEAGGIQANVPLFVFLLLISAVGVFNSLMLNLSGRALFTDAINASSERVNQLEQAYKSNTPQSILDVEKRIAEIEGKQSLLFAEIRNRNNCGQGPAAMLILSDLQRLLPGFRPLSIRAGDPCGNAEELISSYNETIPAAYRAADWYKQAQYEVWLEDKEALMDGRGGFFPTAKKLLSDLNSETKTSLGPRLVTTVKPRLEELDLKYRETHNLIRQYVPNLPVPSELDLLSVRSVGEWSELANLVFDNLNRPTTYIYPALAVFADWLMIYLFSQVRARRVRSTQIPSRDSAGSSGILR